MKKNGYPTSVFLALFALILSPHTSLANDSDFRDRIEGYLEDKTDRNIDSDEFVLYKGSVGKELLI